MYYMPKWLFCISMLHVYSVLCVHENPCCKDYVVLLTFNFKYNVILIISYILCYKCKKIVKLGIKWNVGYTSIRNQSDSNPMTQ